MNEQGSAIRRKLLSRSAYIFGIRFFPAAATLAVLIAFSHRLPKELHGIYQQLWVYLAILVAVASYGIPPLLLTHTSRSVHRWLLGLKARHLFLYALWVGILASVLILLFSGKTLVSPLMLALLFGAQVAILLTETYLIVAGRFGILLATNFVYALAFGAIHYAYLEAMLSFPRLLWGIAALSLLRALIVAVVARRQFSMAAVGLRRGILPARVRRQWLQLGIYDVSQMAFSKIDKLFISLIVGPALFSVYLVGTTDVPFMPVLLGAAGAGLLQQLATGEGSREGRLALVNYSGIVLGAIVFPVFFFLFFFRSEFFSVVFSKAYLPAADLFAIAVLSLPLRAYNFTSVLQHLNRVKTINIGAVLDLGIALALAYPLYRWNGLAGVAFAFMISSYIQAFFYLLMTSRYMGVSILRLIPWQRWVFMLAVMGGALFGLHEWLTTSFRDLQALVIGFVAMMLIIASALATVVFRGPKREAFPER